MQRNPMLQILNQSKPLNSNIQQMVSMIKNSQNPQALLNNWIMQNPQVTGLINQYGGDPKTAFYAIAQQKGIDPNTILNALK